MLKKKSPPRLSPEGSLPNPRRSMGGLYRSRVVSRILIALAFVSALFGGVGLEVCLSEPMWEKHLWLPSLLIGLAVWILASILFQAIRARLFGK